MRIGFCVMGTFFFVDEVPQGSVAEEDAVDPRR